MRRQSLALCSAIASVIVPLTAQAAADEPLERIIVTAQKRETDLQDVPFAVSATSEEQIRADLNSLQGWEVRDGKLHKRFEFADFVEAWGFMSRVALVAQSMDHHPDWTNVYKRVDVDLQTHDAGGITTLDFKLASKMDQLA